MCKIDIHTILWYCKDIYMALTKFVSCQNCLEVDRDQIKYTYWPPCSCSSCKKVSFDGLLARPANRLWEEIRKTPPKQKLHNLAKT